MKIKYLLNVASGICFLAILPVAFFTDWGVGYVIFAIIFLSVTNSYANNSISTSKKNDRWSEIRNRILIKYDYKCSICRGNSKPLQVHHIISLSEGGSNDLDNLTLLCVKCHEEQHNKKFKKNSLYDSNYGFHNSLKITKVFQKAIENKRLVEINYRDFYNQESSRIIKPIKIYNEKGRYYIKAFCYLKNNERHFRLSRLKIIKVFLPTDNQNMQISQNEKRD